jgi:CheY-like chemotaxis protein
MILWIEDDADSLKGIILPLTKDGYKVEIAGNANEALVYLEKSSTEIELIILDLILPTGDLKPISGEMERYTGLDIIYKLKEKELNIPIIVFTVVESPQLEQTLTKLGVRKILLKGRLLPNQLKKQVDKICKKNK